MKITMYPMAALLIATVSGIAAETKSGYGISSWAGWKPGQISRAECPELRSVPLILDWRSLEPAPGKYAFDAMLGQPLKAAKAGGLYATLMIWVGPDAPEWIYQNGVPEVDTDRKVNALGKKIEGKNRFPYYLHPEYKYRFLGLIDAFGKYVTALPPELRERIVFVQCAEGSTGDGQPYKGTPVDKKYVITEEVWNEFRKEAWKRYQKAVPGIPILVNSDANTSLESQWMLENMDVIALKQGMFSHGYQVSDNGQRLAKLEALQVEAKKRGRSMLTRGEMDGELFVMGWSKDNIPQALYWSGIMATHCWLDIWNVPSQALKDKANLPACAFFNKYAGPHDPGTSPSAFCALRDGLDVSDFDRFPAAQFGGNPGDKKEMDRYIRIAKAHADHGARMDDPAKAIKGGMENRKSIGPNDAGWDSLPGNYSRFLTQIQPGSGDVGRWNFDETIYGRFARSFEHQSGKTQMRFKLDPGFNSNAVKVSVTYLDKGTGSWSIGHSGKDDVTQIQNADSGEWKTKSVTLNEMTELALRYVSGEDAIFHLIEVERR